MAKKSFVLYSDWTDMLDCLTNEEIGLLFKAIFKYVDTREKPDFTGSLKLAFLFIQKVLDRDLEKYESVCKNRSKAALKRHKNANVTSANKRMQMLQVHTDNDNDNENENDNDNVNESENDNGRRCAVINPPAPVKLTFGLYKNVYLSAEEKQVLCHKYGEKTLELYIEKLDTYIKTKNPKYDINSHAVIIEKWINEDKQQRVQTFGQEAVEEEEHIDLDKWYELAEHAFDTDPF